MNNALTTQPTAMETGSPALPFILSFKRLTQTARSALPIIMQGIMAGMADIIGAPVMR